MPIHPLIDVQFTIIKSNFSCKIIVYCKGNIGSRAGAKRGHSRAVPPPKPVTVPPTFHPLPSLLNLVDFECESETDKTAHTIKRLQALAASASARDHRLQEERFRQKADANSGLEPQKHCGTRFSTYATGIA